MGFSSDWSEFLDSNTTRRQPPPPAANGQTRHPESDSAYVQAALRDELAALATMAPKTGRNTALYEAAKSLGRLPIPRDHLRAMLLDACRANGVLNEDGVKACNNSIDSGFAKADLKGPRAIPERNGHVIELDAESLRPDTENSDEQRDLHQIAVARRAYDLRVNDEAKALWTRQRAALMDQQPPPRISLTELLAQPDPEVTYRIENLLPIGGRVLLAAQYKAGKTSLIANLLRSLADGDQFLGHYDVHPVNNIVVIDTELDQDMMRRWLRSQNIRRTNNVDVVSLRGRLSTFGIIDDRVRADWATRLHGADFIILDCLRPCLDAFGLSEDKEAGVFLTAFDALCKECGAPEATVVHHMGHNQERSRGDSRLLDWPDVLWKIVRDTNEDGENIEDGDRFFSAIGRDVNVAESQLDWQSETRALTICGGGRSDKKARNCVNDIIEIMSDPANSNGLSYNQLVAEIKTYGYGRDVARAAIRKAVDDMTLVVSAGSRRSKIHTLNPSRRTK